MCDLPNHWYLHPAQCSHFRNYQPIMLWSGGGNSWLPVAFLLPPYPIPLTRHLSSPAFWQFCNNFSFFCPVPAVEAIHLGSLIAAQGYVFPISDHVLTMKDDGTFYRFQVGLQPLLFLPSDLRLELPKKLMVFKEATPASLQLWENRLVCAIFCPTHIIVKHPHGELSIH